MASSVGSWWLAWLWWAWSLCLWRLAWVLESQGTSPKAVSTRVFFEPGSVGASPAVGLTGMSLDPESSEAVLALGTAWINPAQKLQVDPAWVNHHEAARVNLTLSVPEVCVHGGCPRGQIC